MTDREARPATDDVEALSALVDGEGSGTGLARVCRHWRDDTQLRTDWHAYHLIGDVLRSEDLAPDDTSADEHFLQALRGRLAQEPVILAHRAPGNEAASTASTASALPAAQLEPVPSRRQILRRWVAPVGIAAGVVMVASVVLVTRPGSQSTEQIATSAPGAEFTAAQMLDRNATPNTQLDRYLSAHKQFQNATAVGPASSFLRSATYESGEQR
ncbi:MAG: sigma-E factor negative regulatory protein [Leptothrix sp. (in: b-proteobacteria)]